MKLKDKLKFIWDILIGKQIQLENIDIKFTQEYNTRPLSNLEIQHQLWLHFREDSYKYQKLRDNIRVISVNEASGINHHGVFRILKINKK